MPCYSPIKGYRGEVNANGKRPLVFTPKAGGEKVDVPCGQCIGCRLERSRQWAVRIMHEASLYEDNCFVTLTYDDQHLPPNNSVDVVTQQNFFKALRKELYPKKIRFFCCGEYGEENKRPHYHACIFNHDFKDRKGKVARSEELAKIWTKGFNVVGDLTMESAAYVARYILKKVTGEKSFEAYTEFSKETGEIINERKPEYVTMSRRPGIGKEWYKRYRTDVFPSDEVIVNGKVCKPPRYYDKLYEAAEPDMAKKVQFLRQQISKAVRENNEPERLAVREELKRLTCNTFLKRKV